MPMAIPLIGAGLSVAGGIAALEAGYLVVGGMMIAGGAMSAIGALSGDKSLSKWGGLLSLAGGATGLATGAWETAAKTAAQNSATQTLGQTASQTPVVEGVANEAASAATEGLSTSAPAYSGVGTPGAGAGTDTLGTAATNTLGSSVTTPLGSEAAGGINASGPAASEALQNPLRVQEVAQNIAQPQTFGAESNGLVDGARNAWKYITDPKNAKVVEVGSGLISGALKYAFPSELDKAQIARLQYEQMQRDRLNSSIAGVRNPVPFQGNANAQVFNQTPVDASNRFVPMPGLVNQTRGG